MIYASSLSPLPAPWREITKIGRVHYYSREPQGHIDLPLECPKCASSRWERVNHTESQGVSALAVLRCVTCRAQYVLTARLDKIRDVA